MTHPGKPARLSRRHALGVIAAAGVPVWAQARCALAGRTLSVGAPGGLFVGLQSYPRTLALADGEIVLTLDDGPLPGPTGRVLDALAAFRAPATFFLIGRNAAAHPGLVRRIAAEGHVAAHHTFSHPWTLRQRTAAIGVREIEDGIRAVQAAQGLDGAAIRTPFFRYPGFADTSALNGWLAERAMAVFGSDVWASDWTPMPPERQLTLLMARLKRARKGIVLLHDVVEQTAAMFPAFLQALCAGGFRVVGLTPGLAPPPLQEAGPGWRSQIDRQIGPAT
jgi:peptidoglycan/xylan/chitin deacetylase (PgdA/CDA1 family)